jgi:hypothetical protein
MVHPSIIEARLGELKFQASRWFSSEIRELQHILMDHEKIISLACGRYFGSFALLVATDQRLLLIDKRVFFMTIEDTRYDMISEIDYNSQVYSATVTIHTMNKTHKFTSIKYKKQLRELTNYVQLRVMEFRNQQAATTVPMPDSVMSQLPPTLKKHIEPAPQPMQAQPAEPQIPVPPLGTTYNYSPNTSDDAVPAFAEHSPELAQMVGSAAMQATHHRPHRPHPYIQGSLMTRRPIGGSGQSYYQ